ncbi:alpha/beta hydrolase [Spongiactinospora rosea]|uniref:alpha/beta hydrolase n=1 Tax=Spongiactinospora rosea TaxID=2248750 RepID=UPI0018F4A95F|nr:alpha/beta hydrolase [Spongiactinospora rosea]
MRRTVPLLAAALVALVGSSPLTPAQAAPAAPSGTPAIAWQPCPEDPEADCGTLAVPVDWKNPGGPAIDLALARRKATDPAARVGSLLIDPGGPGGSGVDFALGADDYFSAELNRRFDIVGFDPRGVARSRPVVCSAELMAQAPYSIIRSQAEFDAWRDFGKRLRADCRARTGPLFDHVDSGSVAHDMDAIRAALGEDKLTYYGISYGSLMGQMYAERFPGRVRALALDSNMDHSLGTAPFLYTEALAAQDSFDEFVKWCARESRCALRGRDVRAFWADLLDRADRGELRYPGEPDHPLTRMDVIGIAFGAFYEPAWFDLAELLVAIDTGVLRPPASAARLAPDTPGRRYAGTAPDEVEVPYQVFCEDFHLPVRDHKEYARHLRRSKAIAPDMEFGPAAVSLLAYCLSEPGPVPNPQHRLRVNGTPPLLLGNALHDPATGYGWAVNAAAQIGKEARFVTYEGWGHGIYGRSDCTTGAIDDYLISLKPPAHGTRCPAVPPEPPATASNRSRPQSPVSPVPPHIPLW